jgi:hypothetical protein
MFPEGSVIFLCRKEAKEKKIGKFKAPNPQKVKKMRKDNHQGK